MRICYHLCTRSVRKCSSIGPFSISQRLISWMDGEILKDSIFLPVQEPIKQFHFCFDYDAISFGMNCQRI